MSLQNLKGLFSFLFIIYICMEIFTIIFIFILTVVLAIPLGKYIAKVYAGDKTFLDRVIYPIENYIYKIIGIDPMIEMNWKEHLKTLLTVNIIWLPITMFILLNQDWLPLNPDHIPAMSPDLAFHSTCAFITNCFQQHYSGESGMSYLSQTVVMLSCFFLTPAITLAAMAAVFNALKEGSTAKLGNFYVYFVKSITRILFPISFVLAIVHLFNGIPMTFEGADIITTLQGDTVTISRGPVAAFESIKQLGLNGGGFFGVNSAHPFENSNFLTNMIQNMLHILLPIATVFALGFYLKRKRLAWIIFTVMTVGFLLMLVPTVYAELNGNPAIAQMGIDQSLGNMEGKEIRFGSVASAFWSITVTASMNGSVNSMHDSFMPVSNTMQLIGMMVNSFYGGVGTGVLCFLISIVLTSFIASLMIGRTAQILGKKIEAKEMKIAILTFLLHPVLCLAGTALACAFPSLTTSTLNNPGFHGFSEMVYEYTSASSANGSGLEGLGDNTPWWNITCGIVILLGRFIPIIGAVAIAGHLANKKYLAETFGTLKIDTATFGFMLFCFIFVISVLAFFPTLVLGPLGEYFSTR